MMMVDVAWPWGLVFMAILGFIYGEGNQFKKNLICLCYFIHGGRMAIGGLYIFRKKTDFPRYQYAKLKWREAGIIDNKYIMVNILYFIFISQYILNFI